MDDLTSVPGSWPDIATRSGFTTGVAVPISINGVLWGALFAAGRQVLSAATEEQLTRFAELASIAMSAAQARRAVRMLAEAQAALSRVAALVARGAALDEVFTAVATEASHLVRGCRRSAWSGSTPTAASSWSRRPKAVCQWAFAGRPHKAHCSST